MHFTCSLELLVLKDFCSSLAPHSFEVTLKNSTSYHRHLQRCNLYFSVGVSVPHRGSRAVSRRAESLKPPPPHPQPFISHFIGESKQNLNGGEAGLWSPAWRPFSLNAISNERTNYYDRLSWWGNDGITNLHLHIKILRDLQILQKVQRDGLLS